MTDEPRWLHPEGAPGEIDAARRRLLGDVGFDREQRAIDWAERSREAGLTRYYVVTGLFVVLLLLALVAGSLGVVWLFQVVL